MAPARRQPSTIMTRARCECAAIEGARATGNRGNTVIATCRANSARTAALVGPSNIYKFFALCSFALSACSSLSPQDQEVLTAEAMVISQNFVGELLPTLQQALQSGGPANAIEVCSQRAPQIAAELSVSSGWTVKRVSLKPRNASSATPDAWERRILQRFDRRQQSGEEAADLHTSAVVGNEYRFMKAQPVMPLCLTCHGDNLATEVSQALSDFYPADLATGYSAGQVRGAISLRKEL